MKLDIRKEQNDETWYYEVLDKNTGKKIPLTIYADDETGKLGRFKENFQQLDENPYDNMIHEIRSIEFINTRL